MVSSIFFTFGDFRSNFRGFFKSFWPRAPIGPTAGARENRYLQHNSGSTAQNLDFFSPSVVESPRATIRSPENLAETASTGPQTRFFWNFGRCWVPQKKNKCPGPPKRPKTQKNRNSAKLRPFHRNFCAWTPPPMCAG